MRFPMLMAAAMIGATMIAGAANAATSPFVNFDQATVAQAQTCPTGDYWSATQYFPKNGGLQPAGCYRN